MASYLPPFTVTLAQWNPLFANLPVESLVFDRQEAYYRALQESTQKTDSASFIAFMLGAMGDALAEVTPQVTPQVAELLCRLDKPMGRAELQNALGLRDRKSFAERHLKPALANDLIEMTRPESPGSRLQKYRLTEKGRQCRQGALS